MQLHACFCDKLCKCIHVCVADTTCVQNVRLHAYVCVQITQMYLCLRDRYIMCSRMYGCMRLLACLCGRECRSCMPVWRILQVHACLYNMCLVAGFFSKHVAGDDCPLLASGSVPLRGLQSPPPPVRVGLATSSSSSSTPLSSPWMAVPAAPWHVSQPAFLNAGHQPACSGAQPVLHIREDNSMRRAVAAAQSKGA